MADSKLADLTADTAPTFDDLIYTVNDPGGTPADRKVTVGDLLRRKLLVVTADQTLTSSSTTLQNLTGLTWNLNGVSTEIWFAEMFLVWQMANATMDGKIAFTVPAGCTGDLMGLNSGSTTIGTWGPQAVATAPSALAGLTTAFPFGTSTARMGVSFSAMVYDGGTSGAVQLQGAQNTSDAGAITLKKGSFMRVTKLN